MKKWRDQLRILANQDRLFALCLGLTLLYFLHKGILYSLIGSFVPLLTILAVLGLLSIGVNKSQKAFRRSVRLWSALLILWSTVRLVLSTVNEFVKPIPEGHVDGQLGWTSVVVSVAFLFAGIYIWRERVGFDRVRDE